MVAPIFDETTYLQNKLAQLQSTGSAPADYTGGFTDTGALKQYMAQHGMTPEQHFKQYGILEGILPTAFDQNTYLQNKLVQLQNTGAAPEDYYGAPGDTGYLQQYMAQQGMTPEQHYLKYGMAEDVDPIEAQTRKPTFNENIYIQNKLEQLQETGAVPEDYLPKNEAAFLKQYMALKGMTPEEHYEKFGRAEGVLPSEAGTGFDEQTYLKNKLAQLEATGLTPADYGTGAEEEYLKRYMALKGMTPEQHYKQFGITEGIDPYAIKDTEEFGQKLKTGIAGLLADNSLSGKEVFDAVNLARSYDLDTSELADLTGYDKKLFDTISSQYDKTVDTLVDKALENKTDTGDQIKTMLALQSKYGLTIDDIAKATDQKYEDVNSKIKPVVEFSSRYQQALTKPDTTSKDILQFADKYKNNDAVNSIYGAGLTELEDRIKSLDSKWGGYDGYQAENIYNQINKITNAAGGRNWTGSWSGQGGDSAMKTATRFLLERGVDNLSDLGVVEAGADEDGNPIYNLIDKSTGKKIAESTSKNFVLHNYSTGNFFKGSDKSFGIQMTDKGVPVPYQTTEKSGFLYSPVFPLMASFLLPGVGATLSSGIAGLGGSSLAAGTLANTALTQGIMSGALSEVAGGDFGKGFVGGAIGAPISAGISSLLPTGMDPTLAKTITNVGTGVTSNALMGRPIDWGSTALNAGLQYGAQQLPWNLTQQQVNLLGGIALPLLQGQSIDPLQLTGILASNAIKSQIPATGAR